MEVRETLTVSRTVPPRDEAIKAKLSSYQNVRRAGFCGFDDGSNGVFVTTRFADSNQVHYVAEPLGMRSQLTYLNEPVSLCCPATSEFRRIFHKSISEPSSADSTPIFVYEQDTGGDENAQYFLFHNGKHTKLTCNNKEKPPAMHRSWTWNSTNGSAAYSSNERDGACFDLYIVRAEAISDFVSSKLARNEKENSIALSSSLVYTNLKPGYLVIQDFVGRKILVQHYVSVTQSRLFLFTLDEKLENIEQEQEIGKTEVPSSIGHDACILPSGCILFSSDSGEKEEFRSLRLWFENECDAVDDADILQGVIPWNVSDIAFNSASKDLVVSYNQDGSFGYYHTRMDILWTKIDIISSLRSLTKLLLPGLRLGVATSKGKFCSNSDKRLYGFSYQTPTRPSDVYVYDFDLKKLTSWTQSEIGGLDSSSFQLPQLIRYKSFDDLDIPAFVYLPPVKKNCKRARATFPVIIHPHGGPEGQHKPIFSSFYQFLLVELRVAIIDPNVRGSSGYGKTFVTLDDGYNRENSVRDIGALISWIEATGFNNFGLDKERIGVWGGSYGGYMCLASLIHFNDKLACGVDMVGISNFVTFLEKTSSYRRDLRRKKYGDERDPDMRAFLQSISPLTNASKIKAPLMIAQGKNDPRVPLGEAEQIYEIVKANELEVWYMVASNEGHGFKKKQNVDAYQEAMVQFWRKFLLLEKVGQT